jgi:8-oxo-dGTP diphosphatase
VTIIVAAAVVREGPGAPVLITRRMKGQHLEGFWEFPGGKVESGEDPEAAVVRECKEEIDLDLRVIDILDVAWHRYREKEVLLLFYDCRASHTHVRNLEVAEHEWVAPSRLHEYALPPPDARLVAKLCAGR